MKHHLKKIREKAKTNKCAIVQVLYHIAFSGSMLGGLNHYVTRIENIEKTAVAQVDRAEAVATKAQATVTTLEAKVKELQNSLDKVVSTCGKFKGGF